MSSNDQPATGSYRDVVEYDIASPNAQALRIRHSSTTDSLESIHHTHDCIEFHSFLELPYDLRIIIYQYAISEPRGQGLLARGSCENWWERSGQGGPEYCTLDRPIRNNCYTCVEKPETKVYRTVTRC
ncbi:hypothetical protein WAI453_006797 [Rhynchosporium graminicola]|uniref:Uncharacterized protein n=1 Tax=Rhynchosporium graminicola TaxID=2792576 RepID=A0A1E1KUG9_9HELO|nr:uncharacterized protein RCO7_14653 [Rhynchosporium commune]